MPTPTPTPFNPAQPSLCSVCPGVCCQRLSAARWPSLQLWPPPTSLAAPPPSSSSYFPRRCLRSRRQTLLASRTSPLDPGPPLPTRPCRQAAWNKRPKVHRGPGADLEYWTEPQSNLERLSFFDRQTTCYNGPGPPPTPHPHPPLTSLPPRRVVSASSLLLTAV